MRIILGTLNFGQQVNEQIAERMINLFIESGYNEIDTAYRYGGGKTEVILGKILSPSRRQQVFIATKVTPMGNENLRPERVTKQLEESLKRLQTDFVDLLYLHAPDNKTPIEITLNACENLFMQGKFRELGVSNYAAWQVADLYHICKSNSWIKPTIHQGRYNAITRDIEPELLPMLRYFQIRLYAYNPLAGGFLTAKYSNPKKIPKGSRFDLFKPYQNRYWKNVYFKTLKSIKKVCDLYGISPSEAALRWLIHHSQMQAVRQDGIIIGASKIEHLKANLKACKAGKLPEEIILAFNKAWDITRCDSPKYFRD